MALLRRKRTYLDWAAGAPVSARAARAFAYALPAFGNPSSPHTEGTAARKILEEARASVARLMETKPDGVVFTSSATEANNLAIGGYVRALREAGARVGDIHILYLPGAHASVLETVRALEGEGVACEALALSEGALDLAKLEGQLRRSTRLVAVDAVCGETGMRYDTRGVRTALDRYAKEQGLERILLHVDASQMPLAYASDLTRLSCDMATLDAQKIGGVRGAGALCLRTHVKLAAVLSGGGQERGLRPGTEAVPAIAAFVEALSEAAGNREAFRARAEEARKRLLGRLASALPGLLVNEGKQQAPHILNVSLPGRDTDYAVMLLDRAGFAVSTKSACETDSEEGSRAVLALTSDPERATATLRVSWGPSTHTRDLDRFADALIATAAFLDTAK